MRSCPLYIYLFSFQISGVMTHGHLVATYMMAGAFIVSSLYCELFSNKSQGDSSIHSVPTVTLMCYLCDILARSSNGEELIGRRGSTTVLYVKFAVLRNEAGFSLAIRWRKRDGSSRTGEGEELAVVDLSTTVPAPTTGEHDDLIAIRAAVVEV